MIQLAGDAQCSSSRDPRADIRFVNSKRRIGCIGLPLGSAIMIALNVESLSTNMVLRFESIIAPCITPYTPNIGRWPRGASVPRLDEKRRLRHCCHCPCSRHGTSLQLANKKTRQNNRGSRKLVQVGRRRRRTVGVEGGEHRATSAYRQVCGSCRREQA
jgi:hypothetical protein